MKERIILICDGQADLKKKKGTRLEKLQENHIRPGVRATVLTDVAGVTVLPWRLCVTVVDVLRHGVIIKQVLKFPLEIPPEFAHQAGT